MNETNRSSTIRWSIVFLAAGWAVSLAWKPIQALMLTILPPSLEDAAIAGVQLFLISGMIALMSGALSQFHPLRVGLYFFGVTCFLTSLVFQRNVGNVTLEFSLVLLMGRSFWLSLRSGNETYVGDGAAWTRAVLGGAACYLVAWLIAGQWPVGPGTEIPGHWDGIARGGALIIYGMVVAIECGAISGTSRLVAVLQATGSGLLAYSTLGQFTEAGLVLNLTLGLYGVLNLVLSFRQGHTT